MFTPPSATVPLITRKKLFSLRHSRAARNAAASYVAFFSTAITGLIAIPLSVHFLTKQELGLWAVILAVGSYLNFMEMGLGFATGRKMADAIVAKDKTEIDRWWTLTRIILTIQGILVIAIGLALAPLFMSQLAADYPDKRQAMFLYVGMVILQGVKLPFQGAEGILTAQERFHWVPLRQSLIFWVELAVIAACFFSGLGLYSMIWAQAATLLVVWILNWALLAQSEPKLGWNASGLQWSRVRSLFGFSLSIAGVAMIETVARSLPVMILGRSGGLAMVPIYTISNKVATVLSGLGRRTYHSFYPALQRMFIQGDLVTFRDKYSKIGTISAATGLGIAGFVLCFNRMAVELLAKPGFYAGAVATTWFAVATITIPVGGFLQLPLLAAGKMGKSVLVAMIRLVVGLLLCIIAFFQFGIDGLAAVSALLPIFLGAYGFVRGARECGSKPWELSGRTVVWTVAAVFIVILGGYLNSVLPAGQLVIQVFSKDVALPGWSEITIGGIICLLASVLFAHSLRNLRIPHSPQSPAET